MRFAGAAYELVVCVDALDRIQDQLGTIGGDMATSKTKQYALADFRDEMKSLESGATTTPIPLHVLLGEAVDVARYFAK